MSGFPLATGLTDAILNQRRHSGFTHGQAPAVYLARFCYDVAPTNRERALDCIRQEAEAARKRGSRASDARTAGQRCSSKSNSQASINYKGFVTKAVWCRNFGYSSVRGSVNHFLQSASPGVSAASKLPDVYDLSH